MAAYSKFESLSTCLFALFAFLWLSTRLIFFPLRIISSCVDDRLRVFEEEGVVNERLETLFRILILCLWILYVMHWIWFYSILVLIFKVAKGETVKDTRSEDEEEEEQEGESILAAAADKGGDVTLNVNQSTSSQPSSSSKKDS